MMLLVFISPLFLLAQKKPDSLLVRLDQLQTNTSLFYPTMRFAKKLGDTALALSGQPLDSFFVYRSTVIDAFPLSEMETQKNSIFFLVSRTDSNRFVFDSNRDLRFLDEKIYYKDQQNLFVRIQKISLDLQKAHGKYDLWVRPVISRIGINGVDRTTLGLAARAIYRQGKLTTHGGNRFQVAAFNMFGAHYDKTNTSLVIIPANKTFPPANTYPVTYRIGDTIYLQDRMVYLRSISRNGDSLWVSDLGRLDKALVVEEGRNILPITVREINSGRPFTLSVPEKYTLVDFWGTWCAPCIELDPFVEKLTNQYKLRLVKIAYDNSIEKVKAFLAKSENKALNGYDAAENSLICSQLKITSFPTYLLIDKKGKIVKRVVGKDGFKMLEQYLNSNEKDLL